MQIGVEQLKKLRGRSWREIQTRGKQEIAKMNERLFGFGIAEMSDTALFHEVNPLFANGTGEGSSTLIMERIRSSVTSDFNEEFIASLLPSLSHRNEILPIINYRFPEEKRALIERANLAIEGRFHLLGFNNLSFGNPIDWHLEPISGKCTGLEHWSKIDYLNAEVAGDKKLTWELNRHTHFVSLGQAYYLTNEEKYAKAFVSQATSWMDANPPNQGINWASSLELSFRSISWLWALHLFASSSSLTSGFTARLLKFLIAHGRHIESYLSYYFSPNTHLTGEALGLLYLGTAFPELNRSSRWQKIGLQILLEQLPIQIRRDGVYFEQTSYYHRYTADFYLHLLALANSQGWILPAEVKEWVSKALEHLMWITRPDGTSPLIGDDDGGRLLHLHSRPPDDFRDTLATGAALFCRGDWKFVAGDAAIETLWLLGPEWLRHYDELEVMLPNYRSKAFVDSGYFAMRDGWWSDSTLVVIDCGPHGVYSHGHSHADALSFEFAAMGTTWIVDPGTFTYTADAQTRDDFRGTSAHNTATVDNQSQSIPAGAFAWKQVATSTAHEFIAQDWFDYFEGSHDGYIRLPDPVIHRRAILFQKQEQGGSQPGYLIIRDNFTAQDHHNYAIFYHFSPSCRAIGSGNQIRVSHENGNKLTLSAFSSTSTHLNIAKGWVSQVYGNRKPAPIGSIEIRGEGEQEVMSFILPFAAKQQGTHVERQPTGVANTGAFTVTGRDLFDIVIAGNGISSVQCQKLRAIASMAWARFVKGMLVRVCLVHGKEVEVADGIALRSTEKVKHCVVQTYEDYLSITIEGTSRFTLMLAKPWQMITIGKASFQLKPNQLSVSFGYSEGQWQMEDCKD